MKLSLNKKRGLYLFMVLFIICFVMSGFIVWFPLGNFAIKSAIAVIVCGLSGLTFGVFGAAYLMDG